MFNFLVETQIVQDVIDEKGHFKDGGYLDYYLIHANEFKKEELEDNIKFCRTVEYLSELFWLEELKESKTIMVERILFLSNAEIIFKYQFHDEKFKEWQKQVLKILTFQNLSC